jgi:hypothetical protein
MKKLYLLLSLLILALPVMNAQTTIDTKGSLPKGNNGSGFGGPPPTISLKAVVYPNPSFGEFVLEIATIDTAPVNIRIINSRGRVMQLLKNLDPKALIRFGAQFQPGTYYVEVVQGYKKTSLRVFKM